jgi:hypothetical protein
MCIVAITLPVQSQKIHRSCVLLPLHYLYKASKMSGQVYCYHYTTCTKQDNEQSCVLLPLHYPYTTNGNNTYDSSLFWLCTGSVMVTIHMNGDLSGFVQVVQW